ncbi:hypothetical protein TL16_g11180 [Triparma laevis f. inornata]|uniref:Uncharacterized protein n=1 Tax=Triparma laevis f. inornata TaxID=1714386 RepID=A0A9W7BDF3_9STRA|nr:hypothetical protein TL16_g11180 [Triparma laevis f. inornata]
MFRVVNSSTPTPNHAWFLTDCDTGQDIMDTGKDGGKTASPVNGPTCSADGINLDGNDDHVNIANSWEWEGTTSFAVYVKYDSIKVNSRVFDFRNGDNDHVEVYNSGSSSSIKWNVAQGTTHKDLYTSNIDSSTWTHIVVTVSGTNMKMCKNGVLAGTKTDAFEPNIITRTSHILGSPVTDSIAGDLVATPMNGPTCSADGLGLDGSDDWADIDDWEWGGTTSFEVYVKYDSFNDWSKGFLKGNWDSSTWTHVVVTISGTTMKIYKNGVLIRTEINGHKPIVLTRTQHWLGRSAWSSDGYFDGTIVYLKVWHGVELTESYVASTYLCDSKTFGNKLTSCEVCPDGKSSTYPNTATCTSCAAGKYSTGGNACTVCAAEKYQPSPNSASCITCPAGEYQPDKAISAALHISSIDCFPGKKLDDDVLDFTKHDAADDCESC